MQKENEISQFSKCMQIVLCVISILKSIKLCAYSMPEKPNAPVWVKVPRNIENLFQKCFNDICLEGN